jgi:hypothetical protein
LRPGSVASDADALPSSPPPGEVPAALVISDNGSQMRSFSTREFMAALAIA